MKATAGVLLVACACHAITTAALGHGHEHGQVHEHGHGDHGSDHGSDHGNGHGEHGTVHMDDDLVDMDLFVGGVGGYFCYRLAVSSLYGMVG